MISRIAAARQAYMKYAEVGQGLDDFNHGQTGKSESVGPADGSLYLIMVYKTPVGSDLHPMVANKVPVPLDSIKQYLNSDGVSNFTWESAIWLSKFDGEVYASSVSFSTPMMPKVSMSPEIKVLGPDGKLTPAGINDYKGPSPVVQGSIPFNTSGEYSGPGTVCFVNVSQDSSILSDASLGELAKKFAESREGDAGISGKLSYKGSDFFSNGPGSGYRVAVDGAPGLPWSGQKDSLFVESPEKTAMVGSVGGSKPSIPDAAAVKKVNGELKETVKLVDKLNGH